MTGSAKRGLIADPNLTYLEACNLTCEFDNTLKLCLNVPLAYNYCLVQYEGDGLMTLGDTIHQN